MIPAAVFLRLMRPEGQNTTTIQTVLIAGGLLAGLAYAQPRPRYQVTDLGTLGGSYSFAYGINNAGVISGGSATPGQSGRFAQTAFVWSRGHLLSLGTLGGPAWRMAI